MSHVIYKNIIPFDWRGIKIRELTPSDIKYASVAEIEVQSGIKHDTARSMRSHKIYICIEGKVVFHLENKEVILEPKDILVIPKKEWFDYQNKDPKTARLLLIHVPPFSLESEEFSKRPTREK